MKNVRAIIDLFGGLARFHLELACWLAVALLMVAPTAAVLRYRPNR